MAEKNAKQSPAKPAVGGLVRAGKKKRRVFSRYEHFKCAKLGLKWRRPRGLHSKVRQGRKGKPPQVNVGFGNARAGRGLLNGHVPVVVYNAAELRPLKNVKAVLMASSIGLRTAGEIAQEAEKLGILILNQKKVKAAAHRAYVINKQRDERKKASETKEKKEAKPEAKAAVQEKSAPLAETKAEPAEKTEPKQPHTAAH